MDNVFKGVIASACVCVCELNCLVLMRHVYSAEFMRTSNMQTETHLIFGGRLASHHLRQTRECMGTDTLIHYI